ncbi:hypothetical protein I552_7076 [Mycobacterium xenopi 3993]|nr:hypothetical protein I552_7076 [Mycobacterium xenopi 3993]
METRAAVRLDRAATRSSASVLRAHMTTIAPARPQCLATAAPSPVDAPVITTTLPAPLR